MRKYVHLVILNHFGVIQPVLKFIKTWILGNKGQCGRKYVHIYGPMMHSSREGVSGAGIHIEV